MVRSGPQTLAHHEAHAGRLPRQGGIHLWPGQLRVVLLHLLF
jgi:hypothetical protein